MNFMHFYLLSMYYFDIVSITIRDILVHLGLTKIISKSFSI